jgi:hypothetical protein
VRAAVDRYQNDPNREQLTILRATLREVSKSVIELSAKELDGAKGEAVREMLQTVSASGAHDAPVDEADLRSAREYVKRGPAGFPAAMLLVGAWQWPDLPALKSVPAGWMSDYVAWMVATPQGFVERGQADLYPERYLLRLEALVRFTRDQAGTPAARDALLGFLRYGNFIPLYFCAQSLRRHYELRAKLLACAVTRTAIELPATPRSGRRLRVGVINRHFAPQTETYTTLPMFEQLDPERFEVLLFANQATGTPLEKYATSHAAGFTVLPTDLGAQVDVLRAARLDVAVFGTNVTAVFHEVTRLALHRVAPLQVVNNSSCTTTGMPEIDLYVSGTLTEAPDAPAHFTERLGLVAGPAHAFNYEADQPAAQCSWTRSALGIPDDAVVFVSAANYHKVIPEMQQAWARLLAAVPGSRLLLHPFNPNWSSSYPVKRFSVEFDRVLAAHGVADDRLIVSSGTLPSRSDVKELLRVADIYLDTYPFGGVNSLVDPLELGMPVVAWEGSTFRSRMGSALLRVLGLDELIAIDEDSYIAIATRTAADATIRGALKQKIEEAMRRRPVFLDPLAASETFGALLETAYDELGAVGRAEFRMRRDPITVAPVQEPMARLQAGSEQLERDDLTGAIACAQQVLGSMPANVAARHLMGAALLRQGNLQRATDYLLSAVECSSRDAVLWQDLAVVLMESGRGQQALQAMETCVRLNPMSTEAWGLMAEIADRVGAIELARYACEVRQQIIQNQQPDAAFDFVPVHLRLDSPSNTSSLP